MNVSKYGLEEGHSQQRLSETARSSATQRQSHCFKRLCRLETLLALPRLEKLTS